MASQTEMEKLLSAAVADKNFRARLLKDPQAAANGLGVTLTGAQLKGIKDAKLHISGSGKVTDKMIKDAAKLLAIWV